MVRTMNRRDWLKHTALATGGLTCNLNLNESVLRLLAYSGQLNKQDFGSDFKWGIATAAFQTEGAWNENGRTASIWDTFAQNPKNVKDRSNAKIATDFYHRYSTDLQIVKQLNFGIFRFSLAWTRILPNGTGEVNQVGIDYYNRLIDTCLELNLEPWITLYHWDLPQVLQDKGGWENREILNWFGEYCTVCAKAFGDRVKHWIVLNEPMSFVGLGYGAGYHAPGKRGLKNFLSAAHHATLCQAEGTRIVRTLVPDAEVGSAFSCSYISPKTDTKLHSQSSIRIDALMNRLFIEPSLGLGYPIDRMPQLKMIEKYMKQGDEQKMVVDFDFIGVQNYFRIVTKFSPFIPVLFAREIPAYKRDVPVNTMKMEVFPEGIYYMLKQFGSYKGIKKLIVTENGTCCDDKLIDGKVADVERITFFENYLAQVLRAKHEGVNVTGYFVWTLTDNFEWAEGYKARFGLVYTDFDTLNRTIKNSGYWFKDFLQQ